MKPGRHCELPPPATNRNGYSVLTVLEVWRAPPPGTRWGPGEAERPAIYLLAEIGYYLAGRWNPRERGCPQAGPGETWLRVPLEAGTDARPAGLLFARDGHWWAEQLRRRRDFILRLVPSRHAGERWMEQAQ